MAGRERDTRTGRAKVLRVSPTRHMKRANNFKFYGAFRFMILLAGAI